MDPLNAVIDLSHHNTVSDFATVKADGIIGIIHKATQGTGYTDPTYATRKPDALAAGLMWGAYHFGDGTDGTAQAKHFLAVVDPGPTDLIVLDLEPNTQGPTMTVQQAVDFVTYVQSETGRWPGLYSGSYAKDNHAAIQGTVLANCWFWLSQYGPSAIVPQPWSDWTLWQYTDGNVGPDPHTVNGVGPCDRDQFNGDLTALQTLWGYPAATAAIGVTP